MEKDIKTDILLDKLCKVEPNLNEDLTQVILAGINTRHRQTRLYYRIRTALSIAASLLLIFYIVLEKPEKQERINNKTQVSISYKKASAEDYISYLQDNTKKNNLILELKKTIK